MLGNLAQVSMALIDLGSDFTTETRKIRPPQEYIRPDIGFEQLLNSHVFGRRISPDDQKIVGWVEPIDLGIDRLNLKRNVGIGASEVRQHRA